MLINYTYYIPRSNVALDVMLNALTIYKINIVPLIKSIMNATLAIGDVMHVAILLLLLLFLFLNKSVCWH